MRRTIQEKERRLSAAIYARQKEVNKALNILGPRSMLKNQEQETQGGQGNNLSKISYEVYYSSIKIIK